MSLSLPEMPQEKVMEFCEKQPISEMALFGSALTSRFGPHRDIDLLVKFEPEHIPTLFDLIDMEEELKSILGRQVDLRTLQDLSPYFRHEVLPKAVIIYETSVT